MSSCWDRAEAAPELETSHREARTTCAACGVETTHTEAEVRKLLADTKSAQRTGRAEAKADLAFLQDTSLARAERPFRN